MTLLDKIKKIQGSVRWPGAKSIFTYFWSGASKIEENKGVIDNFNANINSESDAASHTHDTESYSGDDFDSEEDDVAVFDDEGRLELKNHKNDNLAISPFALFGGMTRKDLQNRIYGKEIYGLLGKTNSNGRRKSIISMMSQRSGISLTRGERSKDHLKMESMSIPGRSSTLISEWEYRFKPKPNQKLHKKTYIGSFSIHCL